MHVYRSRRTRLELCECIRSMKPIYRFSRHASCLACADITGRIQTATRSLVSIVRYWRHAAPSGQMHRRWCDIPASKTCRALLFPTYREFSTRTLERRPMRSSESSSWPWNACVWSRTVMLQVVDECFSKIARRAAARLKDHEIQAAAGRTGRPLPLILRTRFKKPPPIPSEDGFRGRPTP